MECMCCRSDQVVWQYDIDSAQAARELASIKDEPTIGKLKDIIEKIWGNKHAGWYFCRNCKTSFAMPFKACTTEYYSITYYEDRFYPEWKWDYEVTYRALQSIHSNGMQLLEIGAGNGAFVRKVKDSLIEPSNIVCTEFSDYGMGVIQSYGITCLPLDINELVIKENERRFDVICLFQVLEHLDMLDKQFEDFNYLSSSGGNLFIAVPNHLIRDFYDSLGEHLDWPPGHISRFSPEGLRILAEKHGWKLKQHIYQPTQRMSQTLQFLDERFKMSKGLSLYKERIGRRFPQKLFFWGSLFLIAIRHMNHLIRLNTGKKGTSQWFWFVNTVSQMQNS